MSFIFNNRLLRSYFLLLILVLLFFVRRRLLPTPLELENLPLDIAVASGLQSCYDAPALARCGDPLIVAVGGILMIFSAGWGHWLTMAFAVILGLLPITIYFLFAPIWMVFLALLLMPLLVALVFRLILPPAEDAASSSSNP